MWLTANFHVFLELPPLVDWYSRMSGAPVFFRVLWPNFSVKGRRLICWDRVLTFSQICCIEIVVVCFALEPSALSTGLLLFALIGTLIPIWSFVYLAIVALCYIFAFLMAQFVYNIDFGFPVVCRDWVLGVVVG